MNKKLLPAATVVLACASLLLDGATLCSWEGGGLTQSQDVAFAQAGGSSPVPRYAVAQDTLLGRYYHLTNMTWRVSGSASGHGYALLGPATATLRGSGCCCTYLPISVRRTR